MPRVSIGMKEVCAPALLADSGAGDALDRALAELLRVLRELLLERVGGERGEDRAAAGQDAEHRAERVPRRIGATMRRRSSRVGIRPVTSSPSRVAGLLVLEVAQDLGDAEQPIATATKSMPVGEFGNAEGEARRRRN